MKKKAKKKPRKKKCDQCGSDRLYGLVSNARDCNYSKLPGEPEWSERGYAPFVESISNGDGADFTVCLECGKIQGKFPVEVDE